MFCVQGWSIGSEFVDRDSHDVFISQGAESRGDWYRTKDLVTKVGNSSSSMAPNKRWQGGQSWCSGHLCCSKPPLLGVMHLPADWHLSCRCRSAEAG